MKIKELHHRLRLQLYHETGVRHPTVWDTMSEEARSTYVDRRINEMTITELLERLGQLEDE
jgi:hypothetical protein